MPATVHSLYPTVGDPYLRAVPDTIRTLRTRRGFTLGYLAEQVGKQTPWASKIESGRLSLSGELLSQCAAVLNVPAVLLTEVLAPVSTEGLVFRKYNIPRKVEERLQSEATVRAHVIDRLLTLTQQEKAPSVPEFNVGVLDSGAPGAAWKLREFWSIEGAVTDLAGRMEALGIFITPSPIDVDKVSGLNASSGPDTAPVILLNTRLHADTQRFTLAHELGHLVMDAKSPQLSPKELETRADQFASELLAPYGLIRDDVLALRAGDVRGLLPLQRRWGLHPKAFITSARIHGDLSAETSTIWFRALNGSFKSLVSSAPSSFPVQPRALGDLIALLRDNQWYPEAISQFVNVHTSELIEFTQAARWPFSTHPVAELKMPQRLSVV